MFLSDAATQNRNRRRWRPAVRRPEATSIRSRCSLRQDDRKDARAGLPDSSPPFFPCVILERSEESRSLFFGLLFGLFFVSFRAAAAKNPGCLFLRRGAVGILRSADSALNDTSIAVSLPQSTARIFSEVERNVIASSATRRNLQKSLFPRESGRFRDFEASHVAEREKN